MLFAARELAVLLSVCVFLSGAGCTPAARWAEESHQRIAPGMSGEQVKDEIGEPAQIVRGDPGQPEYWIYRFESGPGVAATILLVIVFVALVVLLVFAGGGGSIGGGGGDDDQAEFRVPFNPQGLDSVISPFLVTPKK